jgi:hypothetical protein
VAARIELGSSAEALLIFGCDAGRTRFADVRQHSLLAQQAGRHAFSPAELTRMQVLAGKCTVAAIIAAIKMIRVINLLRTLRF